MTDGVAPIPFPRSFAKSLDTIPLLDQSPFDSGEWVKIKNIAAAYHNNFKVDLTKTCSDNRLGLPLKFVVKKMKKEIVLMRHPHLENPLNEIHAALEVEALKLPYVAKIYGVWQDSKFVYLVSEHVSKGDLFTLAAQGAFPTWDSQRQRQIAIHMFTAICDLHDRGIAHRDVSLENFVVQDDFSIRIIDLGQAIRVGGDATQDTKICVDERGLPGKPFYVPPELNRIRCRQRDTKGEFYSAKKMDMYQLGVALFTLLVGEYPIKNSVDGFRESFRFLYPDDEAGSDRCRNLGSLIDRYAREKPGLNEGCRSAKRYLDLLERLLSPNPDLRPDAREALEWLSSPVVPIPSVDPTPSSPPLLSQISHDTPYQNDARSPPLLSQISHDTPHQSAVRSPPLLSQMSHDTPHQTAVRSPPLLSQMSHDTPHQSDARSPPLLSQISHDTPHQSDARSPPLLSQMSHDTPHQSAVRSPPLLSQMGHDTPYQSDARSPPLLSQISHDTPHQSDVRSPPLLSQMSHDTPHQSDARSPPYTPNHDDVRSYDSPATWTLLSGDDTLWEADMRSCDTPLLSNARTSSVATARSCESNGCNEPFPATV